MITSLLTWIWAGLIVGVSFVATPAKFLAPSLALPVALEVGSVTFHTFRWVEGAFALAMLGCVIFYRLNTWLVAIAILIVAALMLQYVVLLPQLDARVGIVIGGGDLPRSSVHRVYAVTEFAKAGLLILLGVMAYRHAASP